MTELNGAGIAEEVKKAGGWLIAALADVIVDGKLRKNCKLPFNPKTGHPADHSDPSTGSDFATALSALQANVELHPPAGATLAGPRTLGKILFAPFWGKDYDNCVHEGVIDPEVEEDLRRLDTYAEFSWSGTGIHAIGHGEAPVKGHRKDNREIYGKNRYFVFTGSVVPGFEKEIRRFTPAEVKAEFDRVAAGKPKLQPCGESRLSDYMTRTDFPDASQAVMSLLTQLMYKHDGDAAKVEAEFRQSALFNSTHWKEKWERLGKSQLTRVREYFDSHPRTTEESRSLIVVGDTEATEKKILYAWDPVLPLGKLVHFAGRSSEGKSPVTMDLIARISRWAEFPNGCVNGFPGPRRSILMNNEDGLEDTIIPRYYQAGGARGMLLCVQGVHIQKKDSLRDGLVALDKDIHLLCDLARHTDDLGIIVMDPLSSYLGKLKMNSEEDVRSILTPLAGIAEELNIVVITVGHLNKNSENKDPLARIMGAAAFAGVARSVYMFGEDKNSPDNKYAHIMSPARGKLVDSFCYHTVEVEREFPNGEKGNVVQVVWTERSEQTADDATDKVSRRELTHNKQAAVELRNFLKAGKRDSVTCQSFLKSAGFRVDDLDFQRVRKYAGAKASQEGGKSYWFLPTSAELFEKPPARDDGAPSY
jgi:AAA domain